MPRTKTIKKSTPKQSPSPIITEPLWIEPTPTELWRFDFGKFSFGLFLVIIGLLYLAKNSGWLPLELQFSFWQLWPMLLIFFGLSFVSGKGWTGLLTGSIFSLTVLVIAGIFISNKITINLDPNLTNQNLPGHLPNQSQTQNYPINIDRLSLANSANLQITQDLGIINLSAGDPNKLLLGSLNSNYSKLLINSQASNDSQSVKISSLINKSRSNSASNQLDLQLTPNLPFNLAIDSGASRLNLDLNEIIIKQLQIKTLGSDINLSANNNNDNKLINIQGPLGKLNLNLASGSAIKISGIGIGKLALNQLEALDSDSLATKDYDQASSTIEIKLENLPEQLIINWQ